MRPIHLHVDLSFHQALRCVEYRVPGLSPLRPAGRVLALALRYGLVGAATAHLLMAASDEDAEREEVVSAVLDWPQLVERHVRSELALKLPVLEHPQLPRRIARLARRPIEGALPLLRRYYPLETCLEVVADDFLVEHTERIRREFPFWSKGRAIRDFAEESRLSVMFALNFYERRKLDLDEVPEIALLGE